MTTFEENLDEAREQGRQDAFRERFAEHPPEGQAYIVKSLHRAGCSYDDIAAWTGLSHDELLDLLEMPDEDPP